MKRMRQGTVLGLLGLAALAARAQPVAGSAEPAPLPRYHVELIIFAHNDLDRNEELFTHQRLREAASVPERRPVPIIVDPFPGHELEPRLGPGGAERSPIVLDRLRLDELVWVPPEPETALVAPDILPIDPTQPRPRLETSLDEEAEDDLDITVTYRRPGEREARSFRFRLLEPEELQLGAERARLERLSAYTPLLHGGWVQEGLPEDEASAFDLAYLGSLNPRGTVKLHLSRFLHLSFDLDYQLAAPLPADLRNPTYSQLAELAVQPRYSLETQRRTRSGELHYVDHPVFGVLVLVTPAAEAAEEDAGDGLAQPPAA